MELHFVEMRVVAHAVHFGGGGEDDALAVLDAVADDAQVLLEVELEDTERIAHVLDGSGDGDQRQDDVALAHVVLDPLAHDRDVPLGEVEIGVFQQPADGATVEVHAVHFVAAAVQQALAEVVADESVDAEDQHFLLALPRGPDGFGSWPKRMLGTRAKFLGQLLHRT